MPTVTQREAARRDLVFYEQRPDGVSIVRVLHAASDWWSLLGFVD